MKCCNCDNELQPQRPRPIAFSLDDRDIEVKIQFSAEGKLDVQFLTNTKDLPYRHTGELKVPAGHILQGRLKPFHVGSLIMNAGVFSGIYIHCTACNTSCHYI